MSEGFPKSARDVLAKQTAGDAHLSPDLLNAYVEQSLSDQENGVVLTHLAGCAECREVVFLASGVTEEELLASVKGEAARVRVRMPAEAMSARVFAPAPKADQPHGCAVLEPRPQPPRRWWKWAVPVAAVIAVGVGVLERENISQMMSPAPRQLAKVEQPTVALSQPNYSAKSSASSNQPSTPPAEPESRADQLADRAKVRANENAVVLPPEQKKELAEQDHELKQRQDELQRREQAQLASNLEVSKDKRDMAALSNGAVAKAVPPSEPKPASPSAAPPPQRSVEVTSAAPLVQADNADLSTNFSQALISNSATDTMQKQRATPTHWRISSDGHVERTVGPSTWERVMPAEPVTFRVVATVGQNVWAGGSDGALFHSADGGREWNRVGLAGEQGTIKTIHFNNAQQGSVTTEAGAVWKTMDGGLTWAKQ